MAGTVNKVILIGNLGKDPEIHYFDDGSAKATLALATSETYKDKQTGERRTVTDWHDIVLWRRTAELAEKYLRKGSKIYVEGKLKKRSYQDSDGKTRFVVEVVADSFTMLDRAPESGMAAWQYSAVSQPNKTSPTDPHTLDIPEDVNAQDDLPF